jgi:hypothetical protein
VYSDAANEIFASHKLHQAKLCKRVHKIFLLEEGGEVSSRRLLDRVKYSRNVVKCSDGLQSIFLPDRTHKWRNPSNSK